LERKRENQKYFGNYLYYAKESKKIAKRFFKKLKVFVFGSVVKGDYTPASDIDLVIVSKNMPRRSEERAKIKGEIYKKIGIFSPFEIHMVNEKEFEWYKKFIDKKIAI